MLRRCLLILLTIGIAGSAEAGPLSGRWSGEVRQADGQRYPMNLTLGERSGRVDYPSFPCGGRLVLLRQGARSAIYRERILRGAATTPQGEGCVDGGLVRVRLLGQHLSWQWISPNGEKGLNAQSVLSRQR